MKREDKQEKKMKMSNIRNRGRKMAFVDPQEERWLRLPAYSLAMYKGTLVALKKIYKTHVDLTREVRKEMKTVSLWPMKPKKS